MKIRPHTVSALLGLLAGGVGLCAAFSGRPSKMLEAILAGGIAYGSCHWIWWESKAHFYESQLRRINQEAAEKRSR